MSPVLERGNAQFPLVGRVIAPRANAALSASVHLPAIANKAWGKIFRGRMGVGRTSCFSGTGWPAGRQARGGNGACGFLEAWGMRCCMHIRTCAQRPNGGGLRELPAPGLWCTVGPVRQRRGRGKGGGAMILQSSENGGTVGGDTPARVLGKEHRDVIVASSPPPRP